MLGNLDVILKVFQNHWKVSSNKESYLNFSNYPSGCRRKNGVNVSNAGIQQLWRSCGRNPGKWPSYLELRKDIKKWQTMEMLKWHRPHVYVEEADGTVTDDAQFVPEHLFGWFSTTHQARNPGRRTDLVWCRMHSNSKKNTSNTRS